MQTLTDSGYIPEELFRQQGSTAEDTKFDKLLWLTFLDRPDVQ